MFRRNNRLGCAAICAGLIIILALILPAKVWWLLLAIALVYLGIWYIRCC